MFEARKSGRDEFFEKIILTPGGGFWFYRAEIGIDGRHAGSSGFLGFLLLKLKLAVVFVSGFAPAKIAARQTFYVRGTIHVGRSGLWFR